MGYNNGKKREREEAAKDQLHTDHMIQQGQQRRKCSKCAQCSI